MYYIKMNSDVVTSIQEVSCKMLPSVTDRRLQALTAMDL